MALVTWIFETSKQGIHGLWGNQRVYVLVERKV